MSPSAIPGSPDAGPSVDTGERRGPPGPPRATARRPARTSTPRSSSRRRKAPSTSPPRAKPPTATRPTAASPRRTKNVNIVTNDASIFCDHAEYNLDTHVALLVGDVRIYRNDTVIMAERAMYNFNTKAIRALDFHGTRPPYNFGSVGVFSPGQGLQYNLRIPGSPPTKIPSRTFYLRSKRVRIYPDNRVIYIGSTLYVGTRRSFIFPYFFQSLDQQSGYQFTPGYSSTNGEYLLAGLTFPVTEHITGLVRFDYRSSARRGRGVTFEYKPNKRKNNPPNGNGPITPYASDDDSGEAAIVARRRATPRRATPPSPATTPWPRTSLTNGNSSGDANHRRRRPRSVSCPPARRFPGRSATRRARRSFPSTCDDSKSDLNRTALTRLPVGEDRYRLSLKDTQFFTDDFS